MKTGIYRGLNNDEYHSVPGYYSSSQMKDLLVDPQVFYDKYIAKTIEKEHFPAFDIGTYFHTAILEPDKLDEDCAVYQGIRRGAQWDKFQADNKGKAIITATEWEQANRLIEAVKKSPVSMARLARGEAEVSCFTTFYQDKGEVFSKDGKNILTVDGWRRTTLKLSKSAVEIGIKTRADSLGDGFISDLKSTSGNVKDPYQVKSKVSMYSYDLSAALYLAAFSIEEGKDFEEFIWIFASKDLGNCKSWMASQNNLRVGRKKVIMALNNLAAGIRSNWEFEDSMGVLEPEMWQLELIKQKDEDFL